MRVSFSAFIVLLAVFMAAPGSASERSYLEGYIGTKPSASSDLAGTYFDRPEVQRLFEALQKAPIDRFTADKILSGTKTSLSDLARFHLVVIDADNIRIGFPYFSAEDIRRIHTIAAEYVPKLVADYHAHSEVFGKIFEQYPIRSVDKKRLAFVILAGFSLNWDALDLLEEKGYRKPVLITGPGWAYGFWASQDTPEYSYKGYYWGSSTFPADAMNLHPPLDFSFSSFGDPFSDPRMNFPDLLAMQPSDMTAHVGAGARAFGLRNENILGMHLQNVIGLEASRDISAILLVMRDGAHTRAQICAALEHPDARHCRGLASLLEAAGYIAREGDDSYVLKVPVLDTGDRAMLDASLGLSRSILRHWLSVNYGPIRRELGGLTAVKQGVPYPAMFSQIWHEFFGLATRQLVSSGFIEDPYAPASPWKGSVPALWRTSLYHHRWR